MPGEDFAKIQLSLKLGQPPMLNIYARDAAEFEELITAAKADQDLAKFFAVSDTQAAVNKIEQYMGPTTPVSNTPNCTQCGGSTTAKSINVRGRQVTIHECNQDNGACQNDKGYPFAVWPPKNAPKGRDA